MRQLHKQVTVLWALHCISCDRWVDLSIAAGAVICFAISCGKDCLVCAGASIRYGRHSKGANASLRACQVGPSLTGHFAQVLTGLPSAVWCGVMLALTAEASGPVNFCSEIDAEE